MASSFAFPGPVSKLDLASVKVGIHSLSDDAVFMFIFWCITIKVSRREMMRPKMRRLYAVGSSERLCENPVFWLFWLCKLLILLDGIFGKSTFYTVW